jgi:hypothetical protein
VSCNELIEHFDRLLISASIEVRSPDRQTSFAGKVGIPRLEGQLL